MQDARIRDLECQNIASLMLRYCVPTILATTINATYNAVDRIFVGRVCGENALAAITVCFSPAMLLLAVAMTFGQGGATLLSIRLGQKDYRGASRVFGQATVLFFALYFAALAVMSFFMRDILAFFGATENIIDDAQAYYSIIIAGLIFEKISFGLNNMIRAEGRPAYAMSTMLIGALSNIVLDYVFLLEFNMGVRGAAYATVLAQAAGSVWVLCFYLSGRSCLKFSLADFRVRRGLFGEMCAAGSPSFIMQILAALAISLYVKQACEYGAEPAITVVGIAMAITTFMFLPVVGLAMGMQPIVGYNWGAGNTARVRKTFVCGIVFATAVCVASFIFGEVFAHEIYELFLGRGSALASTGAGVLRTLILCYPLIGVNIVTSGFFQSTKRPVYSVAATVLRQGVFLIPLMYALPKFWGVNGLWWSFPISDFSAFVVTVFFIVFVIYGRGSNAGAKNFQKKS